MIFVADVTDVALEWAERNVKSNPHLSELIEIRKVGNARKNISKEEGAVNGQLATETEPSSEDIIGEETEPGALKLSEVIADSDKVYDEMSVLLGVVKDGENFDFCMCNPPFFESMEEAGLNPKTSCGGTPAEMVFPGGEKAFITRIIEDSVVLKQSFR